MEKDFFDLKKWKYKKKDVLRGDKKNVVIICCFLFVYYFFLEIYYKFVVIVYRLDIVFYRFLVVFY